MSKLECPQFGAPAVHEPGFIEWLRDATERAYRKLKIEQADDRCSVPAQFETLILSLHDFFEQSRNFPITGMGK